MTFFALDSTTNNTQPRLELNLPNTLFFFLKTAVRSNTLVIQSYSRASYESEKVDYECELAVVLGKRCHNVTRDEAVQHILGYTCANDVSARDWQKNGGGGQWCRGKTFATFCPLGPVITTADEIDDPNNLSLRTLLNGKVMQEWNTNDMIFDVPALIEFLSASTILNPGTVILTGTPHGVGFARTPPVYLQPGDEVTVEIEGIGRLTNPVIEETW